MITTDSDELEALLQFLYMAPVGLVQTSLEGEIVMTNPLSAQLMLPLSPGGELDNLFDTLQRVAPELRSRVAGFQPAHGVVLDAAHLHVKAASGAGANEVEVLSLTVLKLDPQRLMAVVDDITTRMRRGRELQQSQAWIHSIVKGVAGQVVEVDGVPIRYTVSAGVAAVDAEGCDLDQLLKRADRALCKAKYGGRNRVVCRSAGLDKAPAGEPVPNPVWPT